MQDDTDGTDESNPIGGSTRFLLSRGKQPLPSPGRSVTEVPREDGYGISYDHFDRIEEDLFAARGNQVTGRPCATKYVYNLFRPWLNYATESNQLGLDHSRVLLCWSKLFDTELSLSLYLLDSCHVMSCHVMLCHVMPCLVISRVEM